MRRILLIVLTLFVLSSCASLPLVQSRDLNDPNSNLRYLYDLESSIAYSVQHDDDYLYLELKTDDEIAIKKIIRNGLYVYMDPEGGKSKNVYFNYPLQKKPAKGEMRKLMQGMQEPGKNNELNVAQMLETLDTEAIFSRNDMAEMIPIYARSNSFKVELLAPNMSEFVYKLRIPLNEISNKNQVVDKLSLGIMSGKFEMPSTSGEHPGGGQGGGMQGGGRSGGGMSGGSRPSGGMQGSDQGGGVDREAMTAQISIWFEVSLTQEYTQ